MSSLELSFPLDELLSAVESNILLLNNGLIYHQLGGVVQRMFSIIPFHSIFPSTGLQTWLP